MSDDESCFSLPTDSSTGEDSLNDLNEEDTSSNIQEYIEILQTNPLDIDNLCTLSEHLDSLGYGTISHLLIKLGQEIHPDSIELHEYLQRYQESNNHYLYTYLKNFFWLQPEYKGSSNIRAQILNPISNELVLETLHDQGKVIPSFADTLFIIPEDQEFTVFRKFYVEKYTLYRLKMKFVLLSRYKDFQFWISTLDGEIRMCHEMKQGSLIQYTFNTLDQGCWLIGLKGNAGNQNGRFRLAEMKLEVHDDDILSENNTLRRFAAHFPVVATIVVDADMKDKFLDSINSILLQVDRLNIYFTNCKDVILPIHIQKNKKIVITHGSLGINGLFHWINDIQGYHFFISPHLIYDQEYVIMMLSKIHQHKHKAVVGLKGAHFPKDNDMKTVPAINTLKQDIRMHLLGVDCLAYFTGSLYVPKNFSAIEDINISFALLGQEQQVSFICVERLKPLVRINDSMPIMLETLKEKCVEDKRVWKYF